jgi:Holliday junction resolvase RusA-like endonuclease
VNQIVLNIDPCPKPRMSQSDRWRSRPATDRYWIFKDKLKLLWGDRPISETMHLIFVVQMPKSWSSKKCQQMNGKPHQVRPDVSNLLKAFEDSLLHEDSVLWDIRSTKIWGEKGSIIVRKLDPLFSSNGPEH